MSKKLVEYESFSENPFSLEKDKHFFTGWLETDHTTVDSATGEVMQEHGKFVSRDNKPFVKIFNEALPLIQSLTNRAQRVFFDILMDLKSEEDEVYLSPPALAKKHGLKNSRDILSGIKELIEADVLSRKTEKDVYFVNVRYIFNGKRLLYLKQLIERTK